MATKICGTCSEEKPLSEFYRQPKGKFGVTGSCKGCYRDRSREYGSRPSKISPEAFIRHFVGPGLIDVRRDGSIWRVGRRRYNGNGQAKVNRIDPPKQISAAAGHADIRGTAYQNVRAGKHGRWWTVSAHRLVWVYFNGSIPGGWQINHKNGRRDDNRLDNLELVTPAENVRHGWNELGRKYRRIGKDVADRMRARYANGGITLDALGDAYGVSGSHAGRIIKGIYWSD